MNVSNIIIIIIIIIGNLHKYLMGFEFTLSPSLLFIREGGAIQASALWHDLL